MFGFADFSHDLFGKKPHKERCLVKLCRTTYLVRHTNKTQRLLRVSEPGDIFFEILWTSLVYSQLKCARTCVHMHALTQNASRYLYICMVPVFKGQQDLKACSNFKTSLCQVRQLLWLWCLSLPYGSEKKPGGFTVANWTECQVKGHLFHWKSLSISTVWKGFVVTVTIKNRYLFVCLFLFITRVDKTQEKQQDTLCYGDDFWL